MVVVGLIVAAILAVVGFFLWNLENLTDVFRKEGRIVEKRPVPYVSPAYPPRYGFPFRPPLEEEWREHYFLRIKLEKSGTIKIEVDRQTFEEAKEGESVVLLCQKGGITGRLKIIDLY